MTFSLADIVICAQPHSFATFVSLPYAAGIPAILRGEGAQWHAPSKSWKIRNDLVEDLRERFPRIVELVRIQQAMDASNGRKPPARTPIPVSVVGDGWLELPPVPLSAVRALEEAGCAPKDGRMWAPDRAAHDKALSTIAAFKDAYDAAAARREAARVALQAADRDSKLKEAAATAETRRVRQAAMDEIRAAWPSARFVRIESRTLDGKGSPWMRVTTPSGVTVDAGELVTSGEDRISRRVTVEWMKAPVFPAGSGFATEVETTSNGKADRRKLANHSAPLAMAIS